MIEGTVTDEGVPVVTLEVGGRTFRALVDTGFNGDLELPYELGPVVHARYHARARSILAAGQVADEDLYMVEFPFDGETVTALATFNVGGPILIGTRLLRRRRLEIDFVARRVLISRVDGERPTG